MDNVPQPTTANTSENQPVPAHNPPETPVNTQVSGMIEPSENSPYTKMVIVGLLVLLLAGGGLYFVLGGMNGEEVTGHREDVGDEKDQFVEKVTAQSIISDIYDILSRREYFSLKKDIGGFLWWNSDAGYSIFVPEETSLSVKEKKEHFSGVGGIEEIIKNPQIEFAITAAQEIFIQNGLRLNETNSSDSVDDDQFYDYILAYSDNETLCAITVSPDISATMPDLVSSIYAGIGCAPKWAFEEQYTKLHPILEAIGAQNKEVAIYKTERVGDFYLLNLGYRRTGYRSWVKKEGDTYVELHSDSGNDNATCQLLDSHGIPPELYKQCFDVETGKVITYVESTTGFKGNLVFESDYGKSPLEDRIVLAVRPSNLDDFLGYWGLDSEVERNENYLIELSKTAPTHLAASYTISDLDGDFELHVPPGTYHLCFVGDDEDPTESITSVGCTNEFEILKNEMEEINIEFLFGVDFIFL